MNKKIIFALLGVFLMTSGIFVLISYVPTSSAPSGNGTAIPALNPVGETAGTSIGVSYWVQNSVANSGTTTVDMYIGENSGYSTVSLGDTSASWSYGDSTPIGYKILYMNIAIPTAQFFTGAAANTVELQTVAFMAQYLLDYPSSYTYAVGTIYANLTLNTATAGSATFSWSTTSLASDSSSDALVVYIYPQWDIAGVTDLETYGTANLNITLLAPSGSDYAWVTGGSNVNGYVTSTVESGTTYTTQTSLPAQAAVNYEIGYHINSASTSFTIPQYESSFDLTWSAQYDSNPQYNGQSPTGTSGTLTGSLTSNSFTVYPYGSTPDLAGVGDVTFSYYLSSQYQVSNSGTATQTASPTYTYSQANSNEATSSFTFSGSTPSTAVFEAYESGTNSLSTDSTTITFTPTITVQNPYYTYTQNQLVASLSGSSSGSSTTSNSASPSFTGSAVSSTSSISPSWTVSLNLYGNVAPSVTAPTLAFQNSGSEVSATFTISQPDFSGELQDAVINWGGGATSSYDNLVPGTYTFYYNYTGTYRGSFSQTYSPYVVVTNVPSPDTNDLSGLITTGPSTSYTFGFSLQATPYASILQRGQYIWLNVTGSNVVPTAASIVVNGQPSQPVPLYSQTGSTYSYRFTSPLFGIQVITAIWTIDPSGLTDTATYEYATALVPPYLGTYVSALYSNTATHSYPITLSGVPAGSGFYQQLITVNNPSSYGINTAGSNVQFTASNGSLLYAWIQSINGTSMQVWVKNYYGNSVIDMQVLPSFENDFSETGYLGNATISNIKYVFPNMTVSGTAGLADTLPTGSLPGSVGFYAYSVGGDYIYMPMQDYGTNTNISFYVWSNGLGDFFFDANSAGTGNAFRFDTRSGSDDSQFMPTNSWTSWVSPPFNSYTPSPSTWYEGIIHFNSNGTVIGYWSYASQNAYGQNATSYYTVAHDGNYIGFIGDGYGSAYVTYWNGLKINGTTSMPLATISSIGTGSVFQANATQTSKIFYNGVSNYAPNPLLQVYTYDIYDSFSSNYITILANPNWTFVSDSGYALPYDAASSELTFFNVSGAGQLQAQFLQPSQEIGQPSFVSLSGSLDGNSVSLYSGFSFQVSYTPFDSATVEYANSSSPEFQLPFGSTATISILDQWGQIVGSYSGLIIDQSTIALTIPMSVSLVYPQFENMYPSGVNITADGHTVFIGAYLSFYIANDTSFIWTVSTYDSSVGHDVNLSGTNTTDGPSYTLIIRGPQAIASEIIYVDSYAGSQTGPLQSAPPDNVSLVVNGVPETIGDTFYGYVGERLDVQVYDVTGQLLYSGTAYMNSTGNSFTAKISDPSYTLSLKNDEQAKPGTAAATEIINVTSLSTGQSYIFPNTIGTEASLYLAAGNYTVYAHDNLTAKFNITLSSDQSYVMFGQQLLTSQQFDNLTSQIYNDTSHFIIIPYSVSVNIPVNATENFLFSLETASGAQFTSSQISSLISNTTVRIGNSSVPVTLINDYPYLEASFRSPSLSGSYTLFIQGYLFSGSSVISGEYSLQFSAETSPVTSSGMHLYIDGSGAQYEMQSYTYDFILTYDNGSSLSRNATLSALSNMTAYVSGPHGIVQHLSPYYEDPGVLASNFDMNQTGNNFSIFASTHLDDPTLIDASYSLPFSVLIPANSIITVPEDTPSQVLANTTTSYVLAMEYPNGTRITGTALSTVAASLSASLRNSASYSVSIQSSASYVYVNFTIPLAGSYTLTLTGSPAISGIVYQLVYSSQITVSPPQSVSHGISVQITVPGTIQVRNVTDATISFLVSSGSSVFVPDQGQTISIMANTSVYIMDGSSQYSRVSSVYQSPGTLYVILNISSPGSYYILVDVHNTTVSSANVSAVARSQAFVASTSNPANPTTGWDQFRNIVTGLDAQILYLVLAIGTVIYYIYRALRRRQLKLDDEENTSGLFMEAMTMFAIPIFNLFKKPVPPELQQIYDAIPARRRNKIYAMITSRRRALMPKPLMIGRKKNEKKQ